ncbi:MAG: hypothetical protein PUB12_06185 [[Clostridium] aminophilum]|uniref:hypothetical protein n=1 Tax=[Clostridium] aminophilum TaxID=1526 RepID=UPI0026ED6F69|nr:hypothetical protein [[Clostridium] aminophilum]MDD6196460.1 hypothetical protein [[Clostridium] aminophilum]
MDETTKTTEISGGYPDAGLEEPKEARQVEESNKKCPQCGAPLIFDPKSSRLKCEFCGYEEEIEEDREPDRPEVLDYEHSEETASTDWGLETRTVVCRSCGARSVYDVNAIAQVCPYCGSTQIVEAGDEEQNVMAPGGVIPFAIARKEAAGRFTRWINGKLFCPSQAKQSARPDAFQGVYLPYWSFDADSHSVYTGRYGRERTVHSSDGNKTQVVVDWHSTRGEFSLPVRDQIVCASTKNSQAMLRGVEPFRMEEAVVYKPDYLAGFTAERYTVRMKDAWTEAKDILESRMRSEAAGRIRSQHVCDRAEVTSIRTDYSGIGYRYILLPVWMSSFRYGDKVYRFVVNGQTGRVSGDTPLSALRVAAAILIGLAVAFILYYLINGGF